MNFKELKLNFNKNDMKKQKTTYQLNYNFESILLQDLLLLYTHFEIKKYANVYEATTKEMLFKCFDEEGNLKAQKLIYLAVLYAFDCIKVIDKIVKKNEREFNYYELWKNKLINFEFDESDYDIFNKEYNGDNDIIDTYFYYEIETVKPILMKYSFINKSENTN
jgi:hypothetical protein